MSCSRTTCGRSGNPRSKRAQGFNTKAQRLSLGSSQAQTVKRTDDEFCHEPEPLERQHQTVIYQGCLTTTYHSVLQSAQDIDVVVVEGGVALLPVPLSHTGYHSGCDGLGGKPTIGCFLLNFSQALSFSLTIK